MWPSEQVAKKAVLIVIPNEVRNLSGFECEKKEGFPGTQHASVHRERNDNVLSFSATSEAATHKDDI